MSLSMDQRLDDRGLKSKFRPAVRRSPPAPQNIKYFFFWYFGFEFFVWHVTTLDFWIFGFWFFGLFCLRCFHFGFFWMTRALCIFSAESSFSLPYNVCCMVEIDSGIICCGCTTGDILIFDVEVSVTPYSATQKKQTTATSSPTFIVNGITTESFKPSKLRIYFNFLFLV